MSPTVRHDQPNAELDVVSPHRVPVAAHVYSYALLALALGTVVVLVLTGSSLPSPGPLLLLAIPLALCMNRFLFFANETGVTADAAVIFAAMVAFHDDAVWLGPLLLALLVGPLDAKHWGDRAWVRMAYNSGSTAVVAGAGLAVFVPLSRTFGSSWVATVGAVALAAVPYIAVETALGSVLIVLLGESARASARHQLPQIWIALPLAVVGALAGMAAVGIGWWCAFLILLPVPLAPELVFVTVPRRLHQRARPRTTARVWLILTAALLMTASLIPDHAARALSGLAAVACLVRAECRPGRPRRTSLVLTVLVVATIAAFPGELPIGIGTPVQAVLFAATAGALTLLFGVVPIRTSSAWVLPFVAVAACAGRTWGMSGRWGPALFCAVMLAVVVAAAAFGPLPWTSRLAGPRISQRYAPLRTIMIVAGAVASVTAGLVTVTTGDTRAALALATTAILEAAVAAAACAVRVWRFAPRRRAADASALAVIGTGLMFAYFPLAVAGRTLSTLFAATCAVATVALAWPLVFGVSDTGAVGRSDVRRP